MERHSMDVCKFRTPTRTTKYISDVTVFSITALSGGHGDFTMLLLLANSDESCGSLVRLDVEE